MPLRRASSTSSAGGAPRVPTWLVVVGPMIGLFAACAGEDEGAGLSVGASWQQARGVVGHRVHVIDEKIACAKCHDMTGDDVDVPGPAVCVDCHEKESRIEHASAQAKQAHGEGSPADCMTCHAFVPAEGLPREGAPDLAPAAWDCMRCHAEQQGGTPAVVIHAQSTCDTCHRPHEKPQVEPSDCRKCHDDVSTTHAAQDASGQARDFGAICSTCHQKNHAPATQARDNCVPCHADNEPIVPATALFAGHDDCIGCHRPHDYEADKAVACRSCHQNTPVLGGGRIAAHADCKSCHDPHAPQSGITKACVSCHTGKHTDHPAALAGEVCSTCHTPHPPMGRTSPARDCSHCHQGAASESDFHGGETTCRSCHTPHQFKVSLANMSLCGSCHQGPVAAAATIPEHGKCSDCHAGLPHRPLAGSSQCGRCHTEQLTTSIVGHRNCRTCHEPHGGGVIATCGSCHEAQQQRAPAGHQACTTCHTQAHTGEVTKSCNSCHADKAKASHANVNGGCESCHSAHGEKGAYFSPSCASCHATSGLQGLHAKKDHQTCSQCHQSIHRTGLGNERQVCGTCHRGLEDHEPQAPRCASCHLFK